MSLYSAENTPETMLQSREEDKIETLRDISKNWTIHDIEPALDYLIVFGWEDMDSLPKHRALLFLLACSNRMLQFDKSTEASSGVDINNLQATSWTLMKYLLNLSSKEDVEKSFNEYDKKLMSKFLYLHHQSKIPQPPEPLRLLLQKLDNYDFENGSAD
jgi:hypothetical protein